MTMTTRSLLLGSIFLCGIGFTACSDDSTDDTSAGGTGAAGTGSGGKATGTGGAARGGSAGVGGVANGGTNTGGVGMVATAGAAGAVVLGTGGAAAGAPGTGGVAGTPVATGGAATGGKATGGAPMAGSAGTPAATGGAAGTPAAAGGAAAGSAGTPVASGGAAAGAAGALGAGGAAAGSAGTAGAAGAAGAAFTKIWSFEAVDGWGIKASTGEVTRIDASAGTTLVTGLTSGIATWTVPFVAAANTAITQTGLENNFTAVDMTGKTVTLNIRWVSGGIGVAAAATGGFDVYIAANDADLTEGASSYVGALALADRGAAAFKSFTYTVPMAAAPWEPTAIRQLNIRLDSRYWTADPQPVFDYTTAVFEIDSVTY